jgi:hypothetical protein
MIIADDIMFEPRVVLNLHPEPATCQHRPAPHLSYIETPKPLSKRAKRRARARANGSEVSHHG